MKRTLALALAGLIVASCSAASPSSSTSGAAASGLAPTPSSATQEPRPTPAVTASAPAPSLGEARFREYVAHVRSSQVALGKALDNPCEPRGCSDVEWASSWEPTGAWATEEDAWLIAHPAETCYLSTFDTYKAAVDDLQASVALAQEGAREPNSEKLDAASLGLHDAVARIQAAQANPGAACGG